MENEKKVTIRRPIERKNGRYITSCEKLEEICNKFVKDVLNAYPEFDVFDLENIADRKLRWLFSMAEIEYVEDLMKMAGVHTADELKNYSKE